MSIEAMKQALEALELGDHASLAERDVAITSLRVAIASYSQAIARAEGTLEAEKQEHLVVEFGMHGEKMMFKIGVQQFNLDYEPDTQDEFNFMRDMLIKAFSTLTHDVKTQPKREPLTDEQIGEIGRKHEKFAKNGNEWFDRWTFARAIEAAHGIKGEV